MRALPLHLAMLCMVVLAGCTPSPPANPTLPSPTPAPQQAQAALAQKPPPAPGGGGEAPLITPPPQRSGPRMLKVGSLPTMGLAPLLIAQARGYFNQEGLIV